MVNGTPTLKLRTLVLPLYAERNIELHSPLLISLLDIISFSIMHDCKDIIIVLTEDGDKLLCETSILRRYDNTDLSLNKEALNNWYFLSLSQQCKNVIFFILRHLLDRIDPI